MTSIASKGSLIGSLPFVISDGIILEVSLKLRNEVLVSHQNFEVLQMS